MTSHLYFWQFYIVSSIIYRFLSPTSPTTMGWLAKAPAVGQCPTAHRYLRSPLGENLYLGGPVSLVNHDPVGRILVHVPTCQSTAARHIVKVVSKRKLIPGSELLWSYENKNVGSRDLSLYLVSEWFFTVSINNIILVSNKLQILYNFQPTWKFCRNAVVRLKHHHWSVQNHVPKRGNMLWVE